MKNSFGVCEYCHASPHLPRCPDAPEPEPVPVFDCDACGEPIFEDDEYCVVVDMRVHIDCVTRKTAQFTRNFF